MTNIVFIPGASSDAAVWHNQMDKFDIEYGCQAVNLVDLDSIDLMSDRVLKNAPPRFVLCGTSMGGYVSLAIMRKAKERVEKLILLNTSARADTPDRKAARQADIDKGEKAYLEECHRDGHFATFLSPSHAKDPALIAELLDTALRVGFRCFAYHQTACMNRLSTLDILSAIAVPTLIVGGTDDQVVPSECQIEMAHIIPHASLMLFDHCGHIAHLEEADKINTALKEFLKG